MPPSVQPEPHADPRVGSSAQWARVLIVEDDPAANDLLAATFREAGCAVVQAFDGAQALNLARTARPTLITLDLALPKLDGIAVLKALKAHAATADIPVLVVSGTARGVAPEAKRGALAVVGKPFDVEYVVRLIRRIIDAG
jgi:DNA-binding response OmpR family regulator